MTIDWHDPEPGLPPRFTVELDENADVRDLVVALLDSSSLITIAPLREAHETSTPAVDLREGQGADQSALKVSLEVAAEEAVRARIGHESFFAMGRAAYRQAIRACLR
jgi:hypothetical protein